MTPLRWTLVAAWIAIGIWAGIADDWQLVPEASSSQDVTEIREVITDDLLVVDPSDCTERETERMVMQGETGSYEDALAECQEEEVKNETDPGPTVNVTGIEVDGDVAHATVTMPDGEASMFTMSVDLAREDGRWKLDYVPAVEIDRAPFDAMMAEEMADSEYSAVERECILSRHRAIPTEKLESQFVAGAEEEMEDDMREAAILCMRGTRLTKELSVALHERAVEDGIPLRYADCFTREFLSRVPRRLIRQMLATGRPLPPKYCVASAGACATEYPAAALAAAATAS
jgi:ribosome-binding factor A